MKKIDLNELTLVTAKADVFYLLFEALDVKNATCKFCKNKVIPEECGGLMPAKYGKKPVVLCKNIVCMAEYMTYAE